MEALRRLIIVRSLLLILVVGLMGCGTNNDDKENAGNEPKNTNESKQMEDFEVTIYAENDESELNVYATITYIGPEAEKNIYHGGSIFYFNIYQQDGDYEYLGAMNQPLLTTTLIQHEAHRVNFEEMKQLELQPGIYEFEAIANISLDSDNMMETALQIPVSTIKEID